MTFKQAIAEGRFARFLISDELFRHNPDAVVKLLSKVLIVRCEFRYVCNAFEYEGASMLFEKKNLEDIPPRLRVIEPGYGDLEFREDNS